MMIITFTRSGERTYTTLVQRDDNVTIRVPSFDRPTFLPHDLAHYVVERELRLKRGFWGRVADGAIFPGMQVVSGRQPAHATAKSRAVIREEAPQGTEAEVLVGLLVDIIRQDLENDGTTTHAILNEAWKSSRPERGPLSDEEIKRVCTRLREAQQDWQALAVDQSITVSWPIEKGKKR